MATPHGCARNPFRAGYETTKLRGPDDVVALIRSLTDDWTGDATEIVVGVDARRSLTGVAVRHGGARRVIGASQLGATAATLDADAVVVVTLLEDAALVPLESDIDRFVALDEDCERHGVMLIDHILIAGRRWRSLRECARSNERSA